MKQTIPEVDTYIDNAAEFAPPILRQLRRLFHQACPEIQETIKWGSPFFEYRGIVGNMSAFRGHVSYGFWKASLMRDPAGLFEDPRDRGMAVLKATSLDDLPSEELLVEYIREAVELNEMGVKTPRKNPGRSSGQPVVPDDLSLALRQNDQALQNFDGFSPSQRKEYGEWVTGAKRQATRAKRLATAIEWLAEGKPRNWKYMKTWR